MINLVIVIQSRKMVIHKIAQSTSIIYCSPMHNRIFFRNSEIMRGLDNWSLMASLIFYRNYPAQFNSQLVNQIVLGRSSHSPIEFVFVGYTR